MAKICVLFASLLAAGCVLEGNTSPDARDYQTPTADGGPFPGFRDGGCDFGTSGTSGDDCNTSGAPDAAPTTTDAAPACEDYTFEYSDAASTVWVTGSFTMWAPMPPGARPLSLGNDGVWRLTTTVGAGSSTYKFIIDGTTWVLDPGNPNTEPDGDGNVNSVIELCSVD